MAVVAGQKQPRGGHDSTHELEQFDHLKKKHWHDMIF